jgi:CrcB protein
MNNPVATITLANILLVAAGGAVGCVARFLTIKQIIRWNPTIFPLGTMFVNIVGSLVIGYVFAKYGAQHTTRIFFATGMLGGFTTFSAFSWDALQLLHREQFGLAAVYIGGSVLLSIFSAYLGFLLGK